MHASSRQTEEAEAGDGGTEPHKSNPYAMSDVHGNQRPHSFL